MTLGEAGGIGTAGQGRCRGATLKVSKVGTTRAALTRLGVSPRMHIPSEWRVRLHTAEQQCPLIPPDGTVHDDLHVHIRRDGTAQQGEVRGHCHASRAPVRLRAER